MTSTFEHALSLHQHGKLAEAEAIYRAILQAEPRHADALHYLGMIAYAHGRHDEALGLIDKALSINPGSTSALANRASVLLAMKRPQDALDGYEAALAIDPNHVDALSNRGAVLCDMERLDEALAVLERAAALDPRHVKARVVLGMALSKLERRDEAVAAYDAALAIDPDDAATHFIRGKALLEMQRVTAAAESFERARALRPDYADAHWCQALCSLTLGDFSRGWKEYEWRWRISPQKEAVRDFPQPLWHGKEPIAGRRLLAHAEQGFGDTIQFCRYVREVANRGASVVLEVQPELKSLLSSLAGADTVIAHGEPLPQFDVHCPLMSLPLALGSTLENLPAPLGYLDVAPELLEKWRGRLPANDKLRVGLAWSGRLSHTNNRHRSIDPGLLTPLLGLDATFVSLQAVHRPQDRAWLARHPEVLHFEGGIRDFADTAALARHMDIVISVDTAIAHLAGALGLPVWVLLPFIAVDWRWLLDRNESPWYPTASLFRQPRVSDWASVIADVRRDLYQYVSSSSAD